MPAKDIKIIACTTDGEGKVSETIIILLAYIVLGAAIGLIVLIILAVSYIIPIVNIPARMLFSLMDDFNIGFWYKIISFACVGGGIGCLFAIRESYRTFSKKSLEKRLQISNFRIISDEDRCPSCFLCEYQESKPITRKKTILNSIANSFRLNLRVPKT